MAEDIGVMRIRVIADTSDVEKTLSKTRIQIKAADKEALQMQRNLAKWQASAAGLSIAGTAARQFAPHGRGTTGQALGVLTILKTLGRFTPVLIGLAIVGSILGRKRGGGGGGGGAGGSSEGVFARMITETNRQSEMMSRLVSETIKTRQTFTKTLAVSAKAADPFGRSLAFHQGRIQQTTPYQRTALAGLADANIVNVNTTLETERIRSAVVAPYKAAQVRAASWYRQKVNNLTRRITEPLLNSRGGAMTAAFLASNPITRSFSTENFLRQGLNALGGGADAITQGRRNQDSARGREIRMSILRRRGPGSILQGSATVQAGTEGEHAFRVSQQARGRQQQITMTWQDQVLRLLQQQVDQGEATKEQFENQQINFGRFEAV